jgi:hypothetical protein
VKIAKKRQECPYGFALTIFVFFVILPRFVVYVAVALLRTKIRNRSPLVILDAFMAGSFFLLDTGFFF